MQVDPIKPKSKAPGAKRLKLKHDKLLTILLQFCLQLQSAPLHRGAHARGLRRALEPGTARQILPATSSTRISKPRFLSKTASYDLPSNIYQPLEPGAARLLPERVMGRG